MPFHYFQRDKRGALLESHPNNQFEGRKEFPAATGESIFQLASRSKSRKAFG